MGLMTIFRCTCGHKHLDHANSDGARCSFGGCPCTHSDDYVKAHGVEQEIPTFPAFDHATGKWAH